MSTIDLQKLGLPQARMKEIIEEDYPAVSLKNRMRMIQQKFAERQIEEPKDIFGPPKNLTDVGFRFESVFNSLMGYMKQLLTSTDKVISVSEITQILQTYSQLASIYNSFVVNELPSNELFRRQIYEKLDMLASLAGKLYTDADNGIFRFSDPLTIQTLRQDIQEPSEFEQIRLRQQPILAPRLQALIEDLENKFLKAMEQIRRDALTRKLRLVDFGNDTPLPGQVRTFIREGDAPPPPPQAPQVPPPPQPQAREQRGQLGIDERRQQQLEAIARRQGQPRRQRQPQILEGFDQPGGPYPYDQPIRPLQPIESREQVGFFDQPGGPYPYNQPVIPLPQPRTDTEILTHERRELDEEAIPLNQRELMIQNLMNIHRNIPEELEERVTNYRTQVLNNRPIEQLTYQQILDFTNFLRGLSYVIPDRQRMLRETALARQREQEEQEFEVARDEPTNEEKIDFISRQLVGNRLDEGLTALLRHEFNLGNLKHKKLRDRLNTYHESVIDRLYRMSRGAE